MRNIHIYNAWIYIEREREREKKHPQSLSDYGILRSKNLFAAPAFQLIISYMFPNISHDIMIFSFKSRSCPLWDYCCGVVQLMSFPYWLFNWRVQNETRLHPIYNMLQPLLVTDMTCIQDCFSKKGRVESPNRTVLIYSLVI